ncbi:uncharacterized protein PHACADRAFT_258552 [Phanerochaete carnosa HHB-10118-sp]|uniref:Cytochrome P450 n=1 Tax=Phanerochaete carnosa (strain HHB-10118-sp) TaxID=650164 RepID=K5WVV3_PHACS|nr:uncharacterized protein PHACADRAFT_258552 [Phanerochaete carnosa HHB-10118-sp]EKM54592.1 hypothetical protein PHACADRAFT_258552 [Phanerochaete carnosa HHB-10118-sp]
MSLFYTSGSVAALLFLVFLACRALWNQRRRPAPFPPGPPADPLIGNVRFFPVNDTPAGLTKLARKYGDVMYFNILGKSLVVLSSQEAASDLLEKRSAIYSSRPRSIAQELIGWTDMLGFLPYGEQFHKQRKLFQQAFTKQGCVVFQPSQLSQTHVLLKKVLQDPERFDDHVRRFSTAVIMEITYGYKVASDDDPYLGMMERTTKIVEEAGNSLTILDFFPSLSYLPSWFPGNWFGHIAKDGPPLMRQMKEMPFEWVRQQMVIGNATPSFTSMHIEELERNGEASPKDLETLKVASAQMYTAGAETTWSSLMSIIAILLFHPEVQRKAQEELDRVVGGGRLPDFGDRESLPYLEAVIQETTRWHPTTQLGLPHSSTADDIYRGMYIPKDAIVLYNSSAMSKDDRVYSNPDLFRPERFLPPESEPSSVNINFGWGRRICPGRHLADASLWIVIASFLTAFEVVPAKDGKGQDIIPELNWLPGLASHPAPYPRVIRPRSSNAAQLVARL